MSCILYRVRHAIAEAEAPAGVDSDRGLTEAGERKMRRVALGLRRLGVRPDLVLTRPLRRAEQTAAILAKVLAPHLAVELRPPLAPGHTPKETLRNLSARGRPRHVLLIGHQPDLGYLASHLLTGAAYTLMLGFKKGGIAAIEVAAPTSCRDVAVISDAEAAPSPCSAAPPAAV
jgi:phosphohistidine phosphatase